MGWKVESIKGNNCFVNKLLFTSIVKIQRPKSIFDASSLRKIVNKHKSFIVYIEPSNYDQELYFTKNLGFSKIKNALLPSRTVRIDLLKSDKELLADMHYKTRYNIKKSQKLGVSINRSNDIKEFSKFWHKCALGRGMFISLDKEIKSIYNAFGDKAIIFVFGRLLEINLAVEPDKVAAIIYFAPTSLDIIFTASPTA